MRTELSISSIGNERLILLFNSSNLRRRLPFCGAILRFWATNQQRSESTFDYRAKARNRDRFSQLTFSDTCIVPFSHQDKFFSVSNSCFTVISERFSYYRDTKFGCVETFLIRAKDFLRVAECNQDFVTPALTHMPIEVVSVRVREHPHEERTPSGLVSWTAAERDAAGIVSRSERKKEIEGGRRGTVQSRKRWTDKLSSSLSKCWELSAQSGHLARRESGFCSTRQFFKEIAILWRNWSILNDEARTTVQILSRDI